MISEQRLKELIEQCATIYQIIREPFVAGYSSILKIEELPLRSYHNISVDKYNKINNCKPHLYQGGDYMVFEKVAELENLFETKEDAEFELNYKRIPKTEYLDLPTWEEFIAKDKTITFYKNQVKYQMYIFVKNKNTNNCRIIIYGDDNSQDWFVFEKPLTKENYLEACEICRKLWLGEEV